MSKHVWQTYHVGGFTHQVGTDSAATGGVHLGQVRKTRNGFWQRRTLDSNGRFASPGPVEPIPADVGESLYATAEQR